MRTGDEGDSVFIVVKATSASASANITSTKWARGPSSESLPSW